MNESALSTLDARRGAITHRHGAGLLDGEGIDGYLYFDTDARSGAEGISIESPRDDVRRCASLEGRGPAPSHPTRSTTQAAAISLALTHWPKDAAFDLEIAGPWGDFGRGDRRPGVRPASPRRASREARTEAVGMRL